MEFIMDHYGVKWTTGAQQWHSSACLHRAVGDEGASGGGRPLMALPYLDQYGEVAHTDQVTTRNMQISTLDPLVSTLYTSSLAL